MSFFTLNERMPYNRRAKGELLLVLDKILRSSWKNFQFHKLACLFEFVFMHIFSFRKTKHDPQLHKAIKDLPFTNEKI